MTARIVRILSLLSGSIVGAAMSAPTPFSDSLNSMNAVRWGCEYACPTVSDGFARFALDPGAVNTNATWSKLSHKDKTFGYGIYSMTFRYNRRSIETEIWAGWALYSETSAGLINEINFGIETACLSRCNDQTLILESYKNSSKVEVIIPTGASLFDGAWHTVDLFYSASSIRLNFDGKPVASITDPNKIPIEKMALIPGARVIRGSLNSRFQLDVDRISFSDSTTPVAITPLKPRVKVDFGETDSELFTAYNAAGKALGRAARGESKTGSRKIGIPDFLRSSGVYKAPR